MDSKIVRQPLYIHSQNFILKMWEERNQLDVSEGYGFAHFFYIMLCSHFEAFLKHRIRIRLGFIRQAPTPDRPVEEWYIDGELREVDFGPVLKSANLLAGGSTEKFEKLPLSKLIHLYGKIFWGGLEETLGETLKKDIDLLGEVRNFYAHGQDFVKSYKDGEVVTVKNTLTRVVKELVDSSRLADPGLENSDKVDFVRFFSQEEMMRYFYDVIRESERKLNESHVFEGEKIMEFESFLPELK